MLFGALEAGGTKMVCAIGNELGEIIESLSLPTLAPFETMPKLVNFFKNYKIDSLGIGSFGPLDLNKKSKNYGFITSTPKLAWKDYPLLTVFAEELGVPVELDTDVNAAALAEIKLGAAKGLSSCLYVTIGTGVGGGLIVENNLVHGLVHPEIGHMYLLPHKDDPMPEGACPYHGNCLEGLASGPSIQKRWGISAKDLSAEHKAWKIEAYYLAQMCVNVILTVSPEKIVLGGGVMQQKHIFPLIRQETQRLLASYVAHDDILNNIDNYIVSPGLDTYSGIKGALLLAKKAIGID